LPAAQRDVERNRHDYMHVLALTPEHRVRRPLHGGSQTWHSQHCAFLDPGRDPDLDTPSPRELARAAGPAVDLPEADRDRRLDVHRHVSGSRSARVAEDRSDDVSQRAALTEEIRQVLWADAALLHIGTTPVAAS